MIRDEFNQSEVTNEKQFVYREYGKTQKVEFSSQKENTTPEGDLNEKYVGKTIKKVTEVNVDYINKVQTHTSSTVVTTTASTTASSVAAVTTSAVVVASTVAIPVIAVAAGISVALHDYQYKFNSLLISSNELRYELFIYDNKEDNSDYLSYTDNPQEIVPQRLEEEKDETAPFTLRVYNNNYDSSQYIWLKENNSGVFEHLELDNSYNIVLSENRYGGEIIYKDSFTTYQNSSFFDFDLPGTADIVNNTFDVQMDFIDDTDAFSNLVIDFSDPDYPNETYASISVNKANGFQTVSILDENNNPKIDLTKQWNYKFSYTQNDEVINFKEGVVTFYDYQGRESRFNEFVFDKTANFVNNTFDVRLDYVDHPSLNWFDEFVLTLTTVSQDGDEQYYYDVDIPLRKTTETQTVELDEYEIYVKEEYFQFLYTLKVNYRGQVIELASENEPFRFTDISNGVSEFNSFIFTKEADFWNKTFDIQLDYRDDYDYYYGFALHLYPDGVNAQYDFYPDTKTDVQTMTIDEEYAHYGFSFEYQFTYSLTAYYKSEEVTLDSSDELFTFTDISEKRSEFDHLVFDGEFDATFGDAPIQIVFRDDYHYFSNFVLSLASSMSADDVFEIELENTSEVQYFNVYENDMATTEITYTYSLTCIYNGQERTLLENQGPITFYDPDPKTEVTNLTFVNGEANFLERSFYVQLELQDDFGYIDQIILTIRDQGNNGTATRELERTRDPQLITIDEEESGGANGYYYPVDIVNGQLSYNLTYITIIDEQSESHDLYSDYQPLSFDNSLKSSFDGFVSSFDFISKPIGVSGDDYEYRLPFRYDAIDEKEIYSNLQISFRDPDNDDIVGFLSYPNDRLANEWSYGTYTEQTRTIQEITNGNEYYVVVSGILTDERTREYIDEEYVFYRELHTFTLDNESDIYGFELQDYMVYGDWIAYGELIYSGEASDYAGLDFVIKTYEGEVLTYKINGEDITQYMEINLLYANERTLAEDELYVILSHPVDVTISYSKYVPDPDDPTGAGIPGEATVIVSYEAFQFNVNV